MENLNIVIVEDDEQIREGLSYSIELYPGFHCIGTFSNAEEMLEQVEELDPRIILMDIGLPGMNGIECLSLVKQKLPYILVVMLTIFEDDDRIFDSIVKGADGYLLKKTPVPKIIQSLHDLLGGGAPMSNQIAKRVLETFRKNNPTEETQVLSQREKEILDQLAKGYTHKQISENLFISPETVRGHLKNIYHKLHVHSKMEAVSKISSFKSFLK